MKGGRSVVGAGAEGAHGSVYTRSRTRGSREGKEDRQTAFLLGVTRIEQVHNHLAVRIHIERRELGRFSLVYNQFRVTTRGGVNVVACVEGEEKERGRGEEGGLREDPRRVFTAARVHHL